MRKLKLKELGRKSVAEFKSTSKIPLVVVLDNIRSMNNVGSVFRTADAFALKQVVLCGITARPPHREIQKTAIGATESVDWLYAESISDALGNLKTQGFRVIGIEQTDESIKLNEFEVKSDEKYALVLGNEVKGLSDEALEYLDVALEIPQFGTKHSLNVSVANGVVSWHFARHFIGSLEV